MTRKSRRRVFTVDSRHKQATTVKCRGSQRMTIFLPDIHQPSRGALGRRPRIRHRWRAISLLCREWRPSHRHWISAESARREPWLFIFAIADYVRSASVGAVKNRSGILTMPEKREHDHGQLPWRRRISKASEHTSNQVAHRPKSTCPYRRCANRARPLGDV